MGSLLYQLVGQWAHNNGKVFVGDPLGISPPGKARRLEHMISLALKFGTTDFFMPHKDQNIPWKVGEHDYNVTQMLIASSQAIYQAVPALKGVRYDFEKRKFRDILGQRISQDMFGEFAKSPGAREARAGRTTLKRSILIDSLVQSAGREGWRSVLEELARQGRAVRLTPALKRIFYSKSSQTPAQVGVSASRITEALIQPQLAAWNEAGLSVEVVQSVADLPADLQARLPDDSVEGFYETQTGKVYLIADRLSSMERAKEVLRHEAVGHWASHHLRAAPEFVQILKVLVRLEAVGNQDIVAIAKQVDATQPGLDRFDRAEEIYSVAVERGLHEKIGLLRTWSTKLLQQVKVWLRKLGFDNRFVNTMTLNDVMLWAKESQQRLNQGGKGTYGKWALAGSRAYLSYLNRIPLTIHLRMKSALSASLVPFSFVATPAVLVQIQKRRFLYMVRQWLIQRLSVKALLIAIKANSPQCAFSAPVPIRGCANAELRPEAQSFSCLRIQQDFVVLQSSDINPISFEPLMHFHSSGCPEIHRLAEKSKKLLDLLSRDYIFHGNLGIYPSSDKLPLKKFPNLYTLW